MFQGEVVQESEKCLSKCQGRRNPTREIALDQTLLEAPANHLWHSEYKASTVETALALDSIAARDAALETLDTLLRELEGYRQELEKARDLYKGIICPVHCLADDVLREIFIHLCEDSTAVLSPSHKTLFAKEDPEYVLDRVCSRWTRVSRSTACLWTDIGYNLIPGRTKHWARFMAFSDRLIARSHNAPLWIGFFAEAADFSSNANAARILNPQIFEGLMNSTHRWEKLSANARCISLLQGLGIIPATLPNVTFICLQRSFDSASPYMPNSDVYPLPLSLPSAHTLAVVNSIEQDDPPANNYDFLNAPNITCVDMTEFKESRFFLPKLTAYQLNALTLCLMHGDDFARIFAPPLGDIVFAELETLNIQVRNEPRDVAHAIPWVLRGLTCPRLSALALCASSKVERPNGSLITDALSDFLSRSGCQLNKLTLSKLTPNDILGLLDVDALQCISELDVRLTMVRMAEVNTLICHLASPSTTYQLSWLWLRISSLLTGLASDSSQPFSVQHLAELCKGSLWKSGTNNTAQIRIEFPSLAFPADIGEELAKICDSTRRSHIRVSFADDPSFWQHHLIDDLEDDL
ncbi:hypothetical protein BKA70DRAFT_1427439 [Coprinopsis sp. MPI-PUGE-AT-0042]|nr:hypothetical protein BKA70DRAFT_1427439 [Coprinopsis sp. MPI-PUGE-AT-0042]